MTEIDPQDTRIIRKWRDDSGTPFITLKLENIKKT